MDHGMGGGFSQSREHTCCDGGGGNVSRNRRLVHVYVCYHRGRVCFVCDALHLMEDVVSSQREVGRLH